MLKVFDIHLERFADQYNCQPVYTFYSFILRYYKRFQRLLRIGKQISVYIYLNLFRCVQQAHCSVFNLIIFVFCPRRVIVVVKFNSSVKLLVKKK